MAMTTRLHSFWQSLVGQQADQTGSAVRTPIVPRSRETGAEAVDIAPNDPLVAYFQASPASSRSIGSISTRRLPTL